MSMKWQNGKGRWEVQFGQAWFHLNIRLKANEQHEQCFLSLHKGA